MNILMLGNGFDLYYSLPTKYINFLNVVNHLATANYDIKTVGDVFKNEHLQTEDRTIAESYEKYSESYHKSPLPMDVIEKLVSISNSNIWFQYLFKSFNKDVGWIDFEREIAIAVNYFRELLSENEQSFFLNKRVLSKEGQYIVQKLGSFIEMVDGITNKYRMKPDYAFEYPLGSGNKRVDKNKVIETLTDELYEFADSLRLYLQCFVDNVVDILSSDDKVKICDIFSNVDYLVTLNYTNTYEKFFADTSTIHLHGNVDEKIVLGINPDETDEVETVDTLFAAFKKYFQRVYYRTDVGYLRAIANIKETAEHKSLIVMGHSLDVTDKDVISQIFELSDDILVLYHSERKHSEYIANLVRIFGMSKFLELRSKKNLRFVCLDDDLNELAEARRGTSTKAIMNSQLARIMNTPAMII